MNIMKTKQDFFNKIAIKSPRTQSAYRDRISKWEIFCKDRMDNADYIPKEMQESIDSMQLFINWYFMEDYNHMRKTKGHSPNSTWNYANSIRKYIHYRGSPLTKDDFEENIELPKKIEKELHGLSLEEITAILNSLSYDDKALFLCQLSSGMRIGELVQLRKRHIQFVEGRYMVKIPAKIAKFSRARTTFFSKEASSTLKPILRRIDDSELIFGTSDDVILAEHTKGDILRNHLKKIGLDMRYEDTGNFQINTHSFRAYFITKVSRHDPNIAKFLAGEKGYLLQYDRMNDEEKMEIYADFEKDLLVFDLVKKNEEIRKLREANAKIADNQEEITDLKKDMALMKEFISKNLLEKEGQI